LNSTTKAWIAAGVGILFSLGIIFWQVRASHAAPINLSADDMSLIVADQAPQMRMRLLSDDNARREFAKNLRDLFAVADEARAKGFANRPEVKRQLELMRSFIISQNYSTSPNAAPASEADVENFFKEPGQEDRLKQFIADAQARNPMMKGQQIPADQMQEIRQQFGQVLISERKGIAAGVDKQRKTQLQIMLQQARLLASMYEEESLAKTVKASQAEIDEYMKAHPEEQVHARHILIAVKSEDSPTEGGLDKAAARAKAEEFLVVLRMLYPEVEIARPHHAAKRPGSIRRLHHPLERPTARISPLDLAVALQPDHRGHAHHRCAFLIQPQLRFVP